MNPSLKSRVLRALVTRRVHERVRGGYRLSRRLARGMNSVPVHIDGYPPLYVDLSTLDAHALRLFVDAPLPGIPHEPELTRVFRRFIKPGDTVFDVGANLGLHTLTFSRLAREVVAFEPNPAVVGNLRETIAQIPNATLLECCLSDAEGATEFFVPEWDHMLGSIANWTGQPTRTLMVRCHTLDSLVADGSVRRPDVLKVDVEGAELLVFRGADRLLRDPGAARYIVFEELNEASRRLGIADGAAADYLRAGGYALYLITRDSLVPLPEHRPTASNILAARDELDTVE